MADHTRSSDLASSDFQIIADLASFVKARRSELGLTQEDVAYAAKLEQTVRSRAVGL